MPADLFGTGKGDIKMKKWKYRSIALLLLCLSLLPSLIVCGESEGAGDGPQLLCASAAVMDLNTGNLIFGKDEKAAQPAGEFAEMMTVLLLAENYDLGERVPFSEILYDVGEDSPKLGLQPGEEIPLYDAACALMLGSAEDVSNGVAEYIAGSRDAFAARMNERAAELGCVNTHFSDPYGRDGSDQYTCAYDIALIARAAYANPAFREICGRTEYDTEPTNLTGASRQLRSSCQMLGTDSAYYQDWCEGGKESYSSGNLNAVMTFGGSGEKHVVSVVMGTHDAGEAYGETAQLISYGFAHGSESAETSGETPGGAAETPQPAGAGTDGTTENPIQIMDENQEEPQTQQDTGVGALLSRLESLLTEGLDRLTEGLDMLSAYAKDHFMVVFAAGCAFMFLLLVLIVLLLLRCITNSRIRRRRKREEKMRQEKESVIEGMSLEELEAELRRREEAENGKKKW